jgi:hypothetical protein
MSGMPFNDTSVLTNFTGTIIIDGAVTLANVRLVAPVLVDRMAQVDTYIAGTVVLHQFVRQNPFPCNFLRALSVPTAAPAPRLVLNGSVTIPAPGWGFTGLQVEQHRNLTLLAVELLYFYLRESTYIVQPTAVVDARGIDPLYFWMDDACFEKGGPVQQFSRFEVYGTLLYDNVTEVTWECVDFIDLRGRRVSLLGNDTSCFNSLHCQTLSRALQVNLC